VPGTKKAKSAWHEWQARVVAQRQPTVARRFNASRKSHAQSAANRERNSAVDGELHWTRLAGWLVRRGSKRGWHVSRSN